jgi:predicted PurR-regulated permease PerM
MIASSTSTIKKLLIVFLVFAGLYFGKPFLVPLATGAVLAALFLPVCKWLERKKWPKGLAALSCVFILLLVIAGIVALLSWQVSELTQDIAMLKQKGREIIQRTSEYISGHLGISEKKQQQLMEDQQGSAGKLVPFMAGSLVYAVTYFILTIVYIFLLLFYRSHINEFVLKLFKQEQRKETQQVISSIVTVGQQYIVGLAKMIFGLWIMYAIGFSIAGVKNPYFFAILCGLLEIVPFVGNLTGSTITLLMSAVQGASLATLGGIAITYGTIQFIQGWVLEPVIVGPQVKINPLATILALVIGELVWGIPGIFLAIPLTAMFKIVCDHIEPLKPLGFLIGKTRAERKESPFRKKLKSLFHRKR